MLLDFTSPELLSGRLQYSIGRKNKNQYVLTFARAYGMAATRYVATLNRSTSLSEPIRLSVPNGRPLIWLDADTDHHEDGSFVDANFAPRGMMSALLTASTPVIKMTGNTRMMKRNTRGAQEVQAQEVELLVDEEDLMKICCYCEALDPPLGEEWKRSGKGYETLYWCPDCEDKSFLSRTISSLFRYFSS